MVGTPVLPTEDLVLIAVRNCLGHSICIDDATPRHKMCVIVHLGCAFELCDNEGH